MTQERTAPLNTFYTAERSVWREWLAANFDREDGVWLIFPMKAAGEPRLSYNDAVEEALCFGWIDSTVRNLDPLHRAQRFSPRKKGSNYSRANIERLRWLEGRGLLLPSVRTDVLGLIRAPYEFPADILAAIRRDRTAWEHYEKFPEGYKRIRVAYIDAARDRPAEFRKRLANFLARTEENRLIGYGGIDKYFTDEVK